jgi:hypothetical protein
MTLYCVKKGIGTSKWKYRKPTIYVILLWNLKGLSVSTTVLKWNGDFALIFLTLWFYPNDFKMNETLPLLYEVPLMVLTFKPKDNFVHAFLPYFILLFMFYPYFQINSLATLI